MKIVLCLILIFITSLASINAQCDSLATKETKSLYCFLQTIQGNGLLVGQQFYTYSGQNFTDAKCLLNTSDCFTSTGSHPAILGVNYNKNATVLRAHILNAYKHGGVITMNWSMNNPVTGGTSNDITPAVDSILPGGTKYDFYKKTLDTLGNFCKQLLDTNNNLIPVIFRPFHENTGSDFWWGEASCTYLEYIALYQFTVSYLRDTLGVRNLLYAYAPSRPTDHLPEQYSYRYPGDNYVDIIGFDRYNSDGQNYSSLLLSDCETVVLFAEQRNKVAAICESGVKNGVNNTSINSWFMSQFLTPLLNDPIAKKVAYWLTWANTSPTSYWIPLPSQPTFQSFDSLYSNSYTLFLNDLPSTIYDGASCMVSSIKNIDKINNPVVITYPNPTTDKFTIEINNQNESYNLEILNTIGQIILNKKITNQVEQVDLSGQSSGIYFVKLQTAGNTIVRKIIKQD